MDFITIDAEKMPTPTSYKVTKFDLDGGNTERSESGYMHRNIIRKGIYKIEAEFIISKDDLSKIDTALSKESFNVIFYDPTTNSAKTKTMYAGDRNYECSGYDVMTASFYYKVGASLIEI